MGGGGGGARGRMAEAEGRTGGGLCKTLTDVSRGRVTQLEVRGAKRCRLGGEGEGGRGWRTKRTCTGTDPYKGIKERSRAGGRGGCGGVVVRREQTVLFM